MLERKALSIRGILLSYLYREGETGATPVVFFHGWGASAELWGSVLEAAGKGGSPVYALDLPGFGRSETPKGPLSLDTYALITGQFMRKAGAAGAIVVGHSFGGTIGIMLAATGPELVSKLVLVDAAGIRERSARHSAMAVAAAFARPLFAPRFMQPLRRRFYEAIGSDYLAVPGMEETFKNVVGTDVRHLLPRIRQETLIVWGEKDTDTPLASAEIMRTTIPHARLEIIPGAGHFSFLDAPGRFADILKRFMQDPSSVHGL